MAMAPKTGIVIRAAHYPGRAPIVRPRGFQRRRIESRAVDVRPPDDVLVVRADRVLGVAHRELESVFQTGNLALHRF